ncbi:UNVERIFIED_CONTAM: Copia protein [Sesamum radiatum]|uniref:Copia protein n=1 Tax=Sesamum radiatum TaxID=300843 RepID=A0AAW2JGN6_SESRA
MNKDGIEYLYLTTYKTGLKQVLERMRAYTPGLYGTLISSVETHSITNPKLVDQSTFTLWHDRLGHPGKTMMYRIIENSNGHPLKDLKFLVKGDFICSACSLGKLITKPSMKKVNLESLMFLERIQGDICGPITPSCGPFKYFMVLIDASTRWSHVSLLSTRNVAFARLLAQIIKLRAHFPDYPIKRIRLDNAGEFTSKSFNDYCQSIGIVVEHPVAHVHTQNGLAESLIKRLQLIARPLLMRSKLPSSAWGHAILHAESLIRFRPTAYHKFSPLQLVSGREPNISHLKVFGCAVYVPIPPPQRTKMGPQRRLGIYVVGFESPSIIKYLEPMTGDQFTARYLDCQFNETIFPVLGGEDKEIKRKDIAWNATSMSFLDPRTNDSELEVQRIIHLQNVANRLPDAFIDTKKVTKSHILAENVPARLEVPEVTLTQTKASESQIRRKRGRPLGSKDANPRKRKEHIVSINHDANVSTSNVSEDKIPEVILSEDPKRNEQDLDDSYEMSINYAHNSLGWYRKEIKMNDIFAYSVAVEIMDEDDNDPQTMEECQHRNDWKSWKKAIQDELDSLNKREVFGPIIPTPKSVKPVGYKWVFVRKRNEQNEVVRYKARLVAQGFTQKPGIDYTETYSPVVDATTLRFLISLSIIEQLKMQLMDVVTAYLYGSLDTDIYMRIPEGLKMPEALKSKPRHMYSIKLKRSLYGLKQSGRMWYNRLKIRQAADYLKSEFEMKDLGTTKYCLGLQFEHTKGGIFIHQSNYIEKVLKRFHMNNAHPLKYTYGSSIT